ncbi:MAG: hypothetical protein AB8B93_09870 [Pseudomonadales bacterium]
MTAPLANAKPPTGLIDNARVSLDFSARGLQTADQPWSLYAFGIDLHTVVSSERGDIGTLTIQPYVLRIENEPQRPALFSQDSDHALQWRITNFNYTGFGQGRFNIRVGHFEVPFGLEQVVQTNGTLNQMNSPAALGLKADWGYSINGELPNFEYEFAFMRGGGNSWNTDANGYFAGRIGLPRQRRWWIAASLLDGEMETGATPIDRFRWGVDAGIRLPYGTHAMIEYTAGDDAGHDQQHTLVELGFTSRSEATVTYVQHRNSRRASAGPTAQNQTSSLGIRFEPSPRWSGSFEYQHQHEAERDPGSFIAQIRLRT